MVFDGPKPLKSIEKKYVLHKNNEKTMPKGTSKVMFLGIQNGKHGPPSFDLSSDF